MWEHVPAGTKLESLLDLVHGRGGKVENFQADGQDDWYRVWNPGETEFHHFRASEELAGGCRGLLGRLKNMKGVKECLPTTE